MTPFAANRILVVANTAPVQLLSWQRGTNAFYIQVRNDSSSGPLYVSSSATATAATAWGLDPGEILGFEVPALSYGISPSESLYVFATVLGVDAVGFMSPR